MREPLERKYLDRSGSFGNAAKVLRIVGPLVLIVGGLSLVWGIYDIFVRENMEFHFSPFVGMFLLFVGAVMTASGFAGAVARYQANQIAPVGKDVVNYMVEGTQESVQAVTRSIAAGLRDGMVGEGATARCPKCGAGNQPGSKFCDQCGGPMLVACGGCGASNQPGSKFCDQCGGRLS